MGFFGGGGGGGGLISNNSPLGGLLSGTTGALGINLSGLPFVGGLFPNPNEKAMLDAVRGAQSSYAAMRPELAANYRNLIGQVNQGFAPTRAAMSSVYGGAPGPQPSMPPPSAIGAALSRRK